MNEERMNVGLHPLVRLAAEASMRANQAEEVARGAYGKDSEMCRYAVDEMKRERAESRRLFSEANRGNRNTSPDIGQETGTD